MLTMYSEIVPPRFSGETAYKNRLLVILCSLWYMSHLNPFFCLQVLRTTRGFASDVICCEVQKVGHCGEQIVEATEAFLGLALSQKCH